MDIPFVGTSLVSFLAVFSVLVFVHEFGHFWVARRFGIKVEVFSIGFGPTLWCRKDRHGTDWRVAALPLGGYVRFAGDESAASNAAPDIELMSEEERRDCFHFRPVHQRALVTAAGPIANFLLAFVIFAALFMTVGQRYTVPVAEEITQGSAAEKAGFLKGDRVVSINGFDIESFEEMKSLVAMNPGKELMFTLRRGDSLIELPATPTLKVEGSSKIGVLGLRSQRTEVIKRGPLEAMWYSAVEIYDKSAMMLHVVGEIIRGERSIKDLGGPIKIAEVSGEVAQSSPPSLLVLAAFLSINLGLINLFPIPVLDGGHLLYYAFEAVRGRPLGQRLQEYGFRVGMALVLLLMVVVTWNDLVGVVSKLQS